MTANLAAVGVIVFVAVGLWAIVEHTRMRQYEAHLEQRRARLSAWSDELHEKQRSLVTIVGALCQRFPDDAKLRNLRDVLTGRESR